MAMTASQFFLYLLIIIILKESLASGAPTDMEVEPSLSAEGVVAQFGNDAASSSIIPAVNMGFRQPALSILTGKLIPFTKGEGSGSSGTSPMRLGIFRRESR